MLAAYATHLVDILGQNQCASFTDIGIGAWSPPSTLEGLENYYGYEYNIYWLASTIEIFGDYFGILDLYRDENLFELGFFIGKGSINVLFYGFGLVLSLIDWGQTLTADPLATTDTEEEEFGDEIDDFD